MKKVGGRLILLAIFIVMSVVLYLPSNPALYQSLPGWAKKILPDKGIALGLDLQGGLHLVLEVEEERAIDIVMDRQVSAIEGAMVDQNIPVESVERDGEASLLLSFQDSGREADIRKVMEDYPSFVEETEGSKGETQLRYKFRDADAKRIKETAIDQALETLRNRVDEFGVAEPYIARQGLREIIVQLPGVKDPDRARALIKKTAILEFKMLDEESLVANDLPSGIPKGKVEEVLKDIMDRIPEGDEILFEKFTDEESGRETWTPYLIKKRVMLAGDMLADAKVNIGEFNDPYVAVDFDSRGAKEFERISGDNIGKRMAIVLDNSVYSAPTIQDRISGGRATITGAFTMEQANDLALVLRAGALPAPLKIIQDLEVGPSLGQDSIDKGMFSTMVAGLLVIIFMMIYYRLSGVIADFALILNLVCLIGALSALNATLTLPGIAGIILTIGMGVDSNVLIFERIREELRMGKPVRLAVDGGYDKALLTIVDAHVTTLITGLALFLFGTGPIKGFAVTLCLGIAINLFTAFVGTKVIFDLMNRRRSASQLSI